MDKKQDAFLSSLLECFVRPKISFVFPKRGFSRIFFLGKELAFCYYRLLLALTFSLLLKSLDLKKIDVYRLLFIVYKVNHLSFTKVYHLSLQKVTVNLS